jgi:hypothetical protein
MSGLELAIIWATAIVTLGVYSILYRENPVSRLFEHIFVGLAAGYMVVITWTQNLQAKWWLPMTCEGRWYWIFAPVVGLLFYFIYSRKLSWLARLAMGIFFGQAAGVYFREFFPLYSPQIWASFKPLRPLFDAAHPQQASLAFSWWDIVIHNWLFVAVLLTVMSYFFFSLPHEKGVGKALARTSLWGRWFLMIAFGAMFGNTVMARLSLFIGRVQFLINDWLGPMFR